MRTVGAVMVSSLGIRILAVCLFMSGAAVGQELALNVAPVTGITVAPNTIASIPRLARAVLTRDPKQVIAALEKHESIDEPVRAKEGARAGFTPLILAAALSDVQIVSVLVQRGADVTTLDDFHRSAFWYAAFRDNVDVTIRLLDTPKGDASKVINAADIDFERTPLHLAVRGNSPKIVHLLLNAGASRNQKDILGETPVEYCNRRPSEACKELL